MTTHNIFVRKKKQKALALLRQNQAAKAARLLEQACRIDQGDTEAWYLFAAVNQELGLLEKAAEAYRRVITLKPQHIEAHYYLGNTYLALGNGLDAVVMFREVARLQPNHLRAHINLGALFELQGNFAGAEENFREALRLDPRDPELHYNLGNVLHALGKYSDAIGSYRHAQSLRPDHADTYNNCGNSLAQLERYNDALACYEQALQFNPRLTATYNNIGNTLVRMRRFKEALTAYEQALQIEPDFAQALTNLGNTLQRRFGKIEEGIVYHRRAIECDSAHADAHYNLAFCLLLKGAFQEGWQEYDWRWMREGGMRRPLPPKPWNKDDLNGRQVFIHAEQGLGDEIFFLRFVPQLRRKGAGRIVYRPTTKIASLLSRVQAIDYLASPDDQPGHADLVCSIGDLPRLLEPDLDNQTPPSIAIPLSTTDTDKMRHSLAALGPPPYIGVTWRAGSKGNELVLYKESPLVDIATLLRDIPATILILQRQPLEGEIAAFGKALGRPVHDLSSLNEDLEQMLALLSLIDEYVGVSNTNMHLRAGVGRTARVLVPAPPEWRWMAEGKESPWFRGFQVYRQGYDGEWGEAMTKLAVDLRKI